MLDVVPPSLSLPASCHVFTADYHWGHKITPQHSLFNTAEMYEYSELNDVCEFMLPQPEKTTFVPWRQRAATCRLTLTSHRVSVDYALSLHHHLLDFKTYGIYSTRVKSHNVPLVHSEILLFSSSAHVKLFHQVSWKSGRQFFCHPADKQTNKPTSSTKLSPISRWWVLSTFSYS